VTYAYTHARVAPRMDASSDEIERVLSGAPQLGRYTLGRCLGRGGMASVYVARLRTSEAFEKLFAIKVIHPHLVDNPKLINMFLHEARIAARIDHTNVCGVVDFGRAGGSPFLVMEYQHGKPLGALARRAWKNGEVPYEIAGRVVADAARGLHAAHELCDADGNPAHVVHRDVAPKNIFVRYDGVTKVLDFGVARSSDELRDATKSGEVRGTLTYMAPEQLMGEPPDRRIDVWALGVILWEITTGSRLFERGSDGEVTAAVLNAVVPSPATVRPGYPGELAAIVMRALARDPLARFATAKALADAIEAFLAHFGKPAGTHHVAELVQRLFIVEHAVETKWIQSRDLGELPDNPSELSSPSLGELIRAKAPTEPLRKPTAPSESRRGGRVWVWLVAAGLFVAAGGGPWAWRRLRSGAVRGESLSAIRGPRVVPSVPAVARTDELEGAGRRQADAVAREARVAVADPVALDAASTAVAPIVGAPVGVQPSHARSARDPQRPRPTPAGADGFLDLVAIPSSAVFEGATALGATPLIHRSLSAGRHTLRLVPADGRPVRTVSVTIRSGTVTHHAERWP